MEQIGQHRPQLLVAREVVVSSALDPYLSLRALGQYSSLGARTLRGFVDMPPEDALPCFRLPGKILVRRSDFDAWLERYRSRGRPSLARAIRELGLDRPAGAEK